MIRQTIASFGGISRRYYPFFLCLKQFLGNRPPPVRALLDRACRAGPAEETKRDDQSRGGLDKPSLAAARSVRLGRVVSSFAIGAHLPGSDGRSYGRSLKPFLPYVKTRL